MRANFDKLPRGCPRPRLNFDEFLRAAERGRGRDKGTASIPTLGDWRKVWRRLWRIGSWDNYNYQHPAPPAPLFLLSPRTWGGHQILAGQRLHAKIPVQNKFRNLQPHWHLCISQVVKILVWFCKIKSAVFFLQERCRVRDCVNFACFVFWHLTNARWSPSRVLASPVSSSSEEWSSVCQCQGSGQII